MKKIVIALFCAAAALAVAGCAKNASEGVNDAAKKYFDAWLITNYPEAVKMDPGYYVISETPGTGEAAGTVEDNYFAHAEYTTYNLDGEIQTTTEAKVAQQLGTYNTSYYYGPKVLTRGELGMTAGLDAAISRMRVGGRAKIIIPGWLNSTASQSSGYYYPRYDTEDEYLENCTGSNVIYDITLVENFTDVAEWETDSMARYVDRHMPGTDTLKYGFYFRQTQAPAAGTDTLSNGDVVLINYSGRLLNGQVFDTNMADTAKFYNIYSSSKTYGTQTVYIDKDDYTGIKFGTSSEAGTDMIDGFAYCLYHMTVGEKATCIFYSGLGYNYSGSGDAIPPYSPLRFDIEIVSKK